MKNLILAALVLGLVAGAVFYFIQALRDDPGPGVVVLQPEWSAPMKELTDDEYPDNPDILIRSSLDGTFSHDALHFTRLPNGNFSIRITAANAASAGITLRDVDLRELMPTIPEWVQSDDYLSLVAAVEAEYSRHQVKFTADEFGIEQGKQESDVVVRVDLSRNCLFSYLWEVILVTEENGTQKPVYHGWFDFPKDLYADLFYERNGLPFEDYAYALEEWVNVENRPLNMSLLRRVEQESSVPLQSFNDGFYELVGERFKKAGNILAPKNAHAIEDFLTDNTSFATFSPPGMYETIHPKETFLSRFAQPVSATARRVTNPNINSQSTLELEFSFVNPSRSDTTSLVIGGLELSQFPRLSHDEYYRGWQKPLGIGPHSFYEPYEYAIRNPASESSYYGVLLDADGRWLDGSIIGIDGVLMYRDKDSGMYKFWILSFERHAFVGHLGVSLDLDELGFEPALTRGLVTQDGPRVNFTEFE